MQKPIETQIIFSEIIWVSVASVYIAKFKFLQFFLT